MCGTNVEISRIENFKSRIKKLKTLLNMWSQRNLSLKGKVAVLRSLALPQMLYVCSVMYVVPKWVIEVETLMFSFLWSSKKAHVRKEVVISEIKNGGLKMPHFASMVKAIKCTWVKRLISDEFKRTEIVKTLVCYRNMNIKDIILSKLDVKYIKISSLFYEQLLSNWYELYSHKPCTPSEALKSSLWNNKFLLLDHKPTMIQSWQKNGIRFLGDIIGNKSILGKFQLENKYNFNIKHMDYNCVVSAIPADWKAFLREPCANPLLIDLDEPYIVINEKRKLNAKIFIRGL